MFSFRRMPGSELDQRSLDECRASCCFSHAAFSFLERHGEAMTEIIVSVPPTVEVQPGNNASNPSSLPPVTYQYALLNIAQTWGALQTFPAGKISLQSSDISGLNVAAVAHNWITSIVAGVPALSQPSFSDISGLAALAQFPTIGANTVLGAWLAGLP